MSSDHRPPLQGHVPRRVVSRAALQLQGGAQRPRLRIAPRARRARGRDREADDRRRRRGRLPLRPARLPGLPVPLRSRLAGAHGAPRLRLERDAGPRDLGRSRGRRRLARRTCARASTSAAATTSRATWPRAALDPVADALFSLPYDSFLIEWEDKGAHGRLLRAAPRAARRLGRGARHRELEAADHGDARTTCCRELDRAATHLDPARLALSPQCGFASTLKGNLVTEDDQWRKLELVVARRAPVLGLATHRASVADPMKAPRARPNKGRSPIRERRISIKELERAVRAPHRRDRASPSA